MNAEREKLNCTLPPDDVCKPDRVIPPPDDLAGRFDLVHRIYGHLLDAKTKQPLLRAEAWEAAKRLRVHIKAGCLSDPPGVALYFEAGKDSATGCSLFRCVRGTNDLEGYHLHMRLLVAWCISPLLVISCSSSTTTGGTYARPSTTVALTHLLGDSTISLCSKPFRSVVHRMSALLLTGFGWQFVSRFHSQVFSPHS